MNTAFVQAPSAHVPLPLVVQGINGGVPDQLPEYVYVKVTLCTKLLGYDTEERLENYGLECISPGEPYVVYGVGENSRDLLDGLLQDPEVLAAELGEPAAGK